MVDTTNTKNRLVDYFRSPIPLNIKRPPINVDDHDVMYSVMSEIFDSCQFGGSSTEDPYAHIAHFLQLCERVKYNNVTDDDIKLRLFEFSIRDNARYWFDSNPPNHFKSWDHLAQEFLSKFFPPSKMIGLTKEITNFTQYESERFYEAWERFQHLLNRCPNHEVPKGDQVTAFYFGLDSNNAMFADAAAGGSLMNKTSEEGFEIFNNLASSEHEHLKHSKMIQMRKEIVDFTQYEGESLSQAWDRFQNLLTWCPHHELTKSEQISTFYFGLDSFNSMLVDATAGGSFMKKSVEQRFALLDNLSLNHKYQKGFLPLKMIQVRKEIIDFLQYERESLAEAWKRYRELLTKIPHDDIPKWLQIQAFYYGLNSKTAKLADETAGGSLLKKTAEESFKLLDESAGGILNKRVGDLGAKVSALTNQLDKLTQIIAWL